MAEGARPPPPPPPPPPAPAPALRSVSPGPAAAPGGRGNGAAAAAATAAATEPGRGEGGRDQPPGRIRPSASPRHLHPFPRSLPGSSRRTRSGSAKARGARPEPVPPPEPGAVLAAARGDGARSHLPRLGRASGAERRLSGSPPRFTPGLPRSGSRSEFGEPWPPPPRSERGGPAAPPPGGAPCALPAPPECHQATTEEVPAVCGFHRRRWPRGSHKVVPPQAPGTKV
ncbi:basic proline-rich protein-like [Cricetulus griseus]|uniref:Basic proline-rich protein-like n=1 Tax=Cricetulus griseus TaxID=10029 RepID=A0A9J7H7F0_CRIGR|nr:basic proline-rich protein-like [Cricetulus griseus]